MNPFSNQQGVTIFELLMVLVISGLITIMSLRIYQSRLLASNIELLQSQVEELFQAMGKYYQANCGAGKALDPTSTEFSSDVSIEALNDQGYIKLIDPDDPYPNVLINKGDLDKGYKLSFDMSTNNSVTAQACVVLTPGTACVPQSATITQANVIMWKSQIMVALAKPTISKTLAYAKILNASCVQSIDPLEVVACDGNSMPGYLVWIRSPTQFTSRASPLWQMIPQIKAFNLQYTHDRMYELIPGTVDPQTGQTTRNYLCGS